MLGVKVRCTDACMELLCQRYRNPVIQYLNRLIGNRTIAEELTQTVFLRVYSARPALISLPRSSRGLAIPHRQSPGAELEARPPARGGCSESERRNGSRSGDADRRSDPDSGTTPAPRGALKRGARGVGHAAMPNRIRRHWQRDKELEYAEIARRSLHCSPGIVKSLMFSRAPQITDATRSIWG